MNKDIKMKELVDFLNHHTKLYDVGKSQISDSEWDTQYYKLIDLENELGYSFDNSPTQKVIYQSVSFLNKVNHNHSMLSLDKTKEIKVVEDFLRDNDYIAMCKMDGLTCSLKYIDGKLVSAETRGDGKIGEDILHNALVIPSIPKEICYREELIVDGEIICTYSNFESFSNEYKNPRNFAAGSIRLLDSKECSKRKLTFVAWDVISQMGNLSNLTDCLNELSNLGFIIVPFAKSSVETCISELKNSAEVHSYPIDGIVFKFNNIQYGKSLGATSHHFKNAIAYKFYDETYETQLFNIEWTMGRTGILTPIAVFEAIEIDGSIVERASLHNISIMNEILGNSPYQGQKIQVYKANAIIPQIYEADRTLPQELVEYFKIPNICPICGEPTFVEESDSGVKNLVCKNSQCEGKLVNRLDHFCGKKGLDIKGLSKSTLEKLIEWNWVTSTLDILYLSVSRMDWIKKPGFGEKSVNKILDSIKEACHDVELWRVISAAGIPLIGSTVSKQLAEYFQTYENFREAINNHFDFTQLYGFGYNMSDSLLKYDYSELDKIVVNLKIKVNKKSENSNSNKLQNINFVITGKLAIYKNREALKTDIESKGGKVVDSISSNTTYLINNDINSTSSKNLKAKKLGIPIITEQEFLEKFK